MEISDQEEIIIKEYRSTVSLLQSLWEEIGYEESSEVQINRINAEIKKSLQEIIVKEEKKKREITVNIEKLGHQFYTLNKELQAGLAEPAGDFSLLELQQFLSKNVDVLMMEVKKRNTRLKELKSEEEELCRRMLEEPSMTRTAKVPSLEVIQDLERRIRTLEQEKMSREKNFNFLQSRILELHEELEHKPIGSFEFDILRGVDYFVLSQVNLQKLKDMKTELEQKVELNRQEILRVKSQIERLWKWLEVEESEKGEFISAAEGCAPSTLEKLNDELKQLKESQQRNISKCINKMRREIEGYWEKCYIDEFECDSFKDYFTDQYSEAVLESHEQELQKLSQYYQENIALFQKIEQRKKLWEKFIDLEERANDPNRYGNRGGGLLKEEKERKTVRKELPHIERDLRNLVSQWEATNGKVFKVMGMSIEDYIENEWLQHNEKKENEKKKKQNDRLNTLHYESRMGSRPPAVKRRMLANETVRKFQRVVEDHPLSLKSKDTSRRVLRERNQNSVRERNNESEVSTYSRFAEGIHRRSQQDNVRSSVVSGINKLPSSSIYRQSPHRPPPGLPKTPKTVSRVSTRLSPKTVPRVSKCVSPKTVPRAPSRCSPRLSGTLSARRSSRAMTSSRIAFSPSSLGKSRNMSRVNFSPGASPLFRSPRTKTKQSPSKWNKLTFLI